MNATKLKCANPSKHTKICSEHFIPTDFRINLGGCYRHHLKNDAAPSVKLSPSSSSSSPPQLSSSCTSSSPPKKVPRLESNQYLSQCSLSSSTPNNLPSLPLIKEELETIKKVYIFRTII
ncbi:unnamed protein product [Macrosiphum euphorbiae]|uniref:THAP-type domain-containing protein n=1 Tax=Macrosiphum euphorbiae TaxID=13131 RepID=A0AAV0XGV5_9HEMI|nr:unnamed protein product [Macrosiphum euphorbiae]